jgi:hypothetical protein
MSTFGVRIRVFGCSKGEHMHVTDVRLNHGTIKILPRETEPKRRKDLQTLVSDVEQSEDIFQLVATTTTDRLQC